MLKDNSITTQLLFGTVRIIAKDAQGNPSYGTGFFFNFKVDEERQVPVIITNNHVVSGAVSGTFFVHQASEDLQVPSEKSYPINVSDFEQRFIKHPNQEIDLCAMPIGSLIEQAASQKLNIFNRCMDESLIPTQSQLEDLRAMEDIVMVGYPVGLWDEVNNFPLLRRGITSSHPGTDFAGKSIGVVDIAAFPGSSGSPICIVNEGSYSTPNGTFFGGSRFLLLGILYAGPQFTANGEVQIVEVPTVQKAIANTMIPAHLGFYIKAKEIIKLKEHLFSVLNIKADGDNQASTTLVK